MKDMLIFFDSRIVVRTKVAKMLKAANKKLKKINKQYSLWVVYGYRSSEIQRKYFNDEFKKIKKNNKNSGIKELIELTHKRVAVPGVAGHPTGGSVDLTIFSIKTKKSLDMGGEIADFFDERLATFSSGLTLNQRNNRKILCDVMKDTGFCPFYEEWWHFSYGDREWAWFYDKKRAIYNQIEINDVERLL